MVPSVVAETTFRDIMRVICHIDFKCGSISFHKVEEVASKISAPLHDSFKVQCSHYVKTSHLRNKSINWFLQDVTIVR